LYKITEKHTATNLYQSFGTKCAAGESCSTGQKQKQSHATASLLKASIVKAHCAVRLRLPKTPPALFICIKKQSDHRAEHVEVV